MPPSDVLPLDALHILEERGFVKQSSDQPGLAAHLKNGPVAFYAGFDPTAPSLHVGHAVPLMAMAHLGQAGHRPIALMGGGTAMVGDPSGKTELRPLLDQETIQSNQTQIAAQVRRYLGDAADRALFLDNAEWLLSLKYIEFLRDIGRHFSVNRMLAAEAYKQRLLRGLSFLEFNYQLLQAYDFLVLFRQHGCTLQIGGDDQWGNILAGTDLIRRLEHKDAYALTLGLLVNAQGAKMGKTATGSVWLAADRTSPFAFFQYLVNVDDADVIRLLKVLTFLPLPEIERYARLEGHELRAAKQTLAYEATRIAHGVEEADKAKNATLAAFGAGHGQTTDASLIPTYTVELTGSPAPLKIVDVLCAAGLAPSRSAARRLIEQGGVRLGDRPVTSIDEPFQSDALPPEGALLRVGRKHVKRIIAKR
jgi:tyrosyl-tRNA synthetase